MEAWARLSGAPDTLVRCMLRCAVESTHWADPESVAPDDALRYRFRFDFNDRVLQISTRNQSSFSHLFSPHLFFSLTLEWWKYRSQRVSPQTADEAFEISTTGG
jgi:hypothetical protein